MITWNEILIRLTLGALLGGLVGIERERKNWTAGLRTHMMVCVGSTLTMIVSSYGFHDILGTPNVTLDPSRVAAQVISGIGFIGAGTILFLRQEVIRGLTTASGLWTVAAIGLAVGGGLYFAAAITTVIVIIILSLLKPLEKKYFSRYKYQLLKVHFRPSEDVVPTVQKIFAFHQVTIANMHLDKRNEENVLQLRFANTRQSEEAVIINAVGNIAAVTHVSWSNA